MRPPGWLAGLLRQARSSPATLLAIGAAALIVAAVIGWRIGRAPAPPVAASAGLRTVSVGQVDLKVPSLWGRTTLDGTVVAGQDPGLTQAFAPVPGTPVYAVVTVGAADDPSLVPAALRAALAGPLPRPVPAVLGRRPAWLYPGLRVRRGGKLMDITVVATTLGVVAVACVADPGWEAGCRPLDVERLTPREGRVLLPTADTAFRLRLAGEVERLDHARDASQRRLDGARTRAAQGVAIRRLAATYASAATRIAPLAGGQGIAGEVVSALREAAAALHSAGLAADAAGYKVATGRVAQAEARLDAALAKVAGVAVA